MTALTTILALLVMALAIGEGSELLQPMAITAIGGLIYATLLTLVVVPTIYAMLNRKAMLKETKDAANQG
jgi:HAE1 family hydrophobic/amphiphilic exporter-1